MSDDDRIAETILALLHKRAPGATICPSEVARALQVSGWRSLMPRVRAIAAKLAEADRVELRQRGRVVASLSEIRGPMRIALVPEASARKPPSHERA